jgi:hypothetical protein
VFGAHTENSDLLAAGSAAVVSPCLPPSSRRRLKLQCSGLSWGARLRRNPHPQAQFIQSFLFNCASFAAMNARISADMSSSARVEARRCSGTFLHSIKRASAGRSSGEWSDDARADASLKWAGHNLLILLTRDSQKAQGFFGTPRPTRSRPRRGSTDSAC